MNLKKPITLIGLMGAGKTTVGIYLAKRLEVPFFDSDKEIEKQAGIPIAEIFERDGEAFFRNVEMKTIKNILEKGEPCVLATGGGAMMNEEIRDVVKQSSVSVWLNAALETLLERVEASDNRPLLNNVDKKQVLQKLIEERYPIYAKADIMVDTDSNSRPIIIGEIIKQLESL